MRTAYLIGQFHPRHTRHSVIRDQEVCEQSLFEKLDGFACRVHLGYFMAKIFQ